MNLIGNETRTDPNGEIFSFAEVERAVTVRPSSVWRKRLGLALACEISKGGAQFSLPGGAGRGEGEGCTPKDFMTHCARVITATLLLLLAATIIFPERAHAAPAAEVPADRWLEIDLYWFERGDMQGSVDKFWERFAPIFEGQSGWRGVILNVGWMVDYVMDWRGDLNQRIPFPPSKQEPWFEVGGQLAGTTEERMAKWQERFAKPVNFLKKDYEPWTYGDLQKLAELLRRTAAHQYGYPDMRIGALVVGWPNIYQGQSAWAKNNPKAFLGGGINNGYRLPADATHYGAFPKGIPEGTPFYEVFGRQWGSLSKAVGLDAIVLRDSMFLPCQYGRKGPYGAVASSPEKAAAWSAAARGLVRVTKQSNRQALVLGYSNAASAVADWRANCVDLESLAKDGYLDAWIDQTWAGAWNEVGLRQFTYWNRPSCGWTYQMTYMLIHAAVLADTKVRHYHLAETFDAWESWDVIHTAPERLRWGIWAYSHAAVKTPKGVKLPAGTYISWANQGKRLLAEEDVTFLKTNLNEAFLDANNVRDVSGPTLVYNRDAMQWQMNHAASGLEIKEWIDEQAGTIMKWPVPIMSATRIEWLPKVKSDMWLVQTPVHLSPRNSKGLANVIKSGQPTMLVGSAVDGIDPDIAALVGIEAASPDKTKYKFEATLAGPIPGITDGLTNAFPTRQWWSSNRVTGAARAVYHVDGSPALVMNTAGGRRVAFWDAPEFITGPGGPLRKTLGGSALPYVLTARVANSFLADTGALHAAEIDPDQTVSIMSWQSKDGSRRVLAGNVEEGWRDDPDQSRRATLVLPEDWLSRSAGLKLDDVWGKRNRTTGRNLTIELGQAESALLKF